MKILSVMVPLLLSVSAFASGNSTYVGNKTGGIESTSDMGCSLILSTIYSKSGKKLTQGEVENNTMLLTEVAPGNCSVLIGNEYPEGPYGGTLRLMVNLSSDCLQVVSFHFQSGMKQGQPVGYSCGSLVLKVK